MRPAGLPSGARWWHDGSCGVVLVISAAHRGLVEAIEETLPGATWQRCRTHELAGSAGHGGHVGSSPWVATLVRTIFDQPDANEVEAQFQRVTEALARKLPEAADHLETAREDLLALPHFR